MSQLVSTGSITITDTNDYLYQGKTPPANPIKGVTTWIDTSVIPPLHKLWDGTAWIVVNEVKIGGRNLIKNSAQVKSNANYELAIYNLTSDHTFVNEEEYTITIWGSLGADRIEFNAYNSGGAVWLGSLKKIKDGIYQTSFKWKNTYANNTSIYIYQSSPSGTSTSTINKIKLEKGNIATDYSVAPEDIDAQFALVNQEISDVDNKLNGLQGTINTTFKDGIIEQAEAKAIEKYINNLNAEKADVSAKYTATYNDANLTDKAPLQAAWSAYDTSHGQLISEINNAISDGKTNSDEKRDVDTRFADYRNKLAALSTASEVALKAIEKKKIDGIQVGGKNLILNSKKILQSGGYEIGTLDLSEDLIDGQEYVFTARGALAGSNEIYIGQHPSTVSIAYAKNDSAFHYQVKFIFNKNPSYPNDVRNKLRLYNTGSTNYSGSLSKFKLEKGNVETDYSEAPEDTDTKINSLVASSDVEYYSSTSSTSPTGGSWQTTAPAWTDGKFIFARTKVTKADGTISYSPSTNGTNITGAKGANGVAGQGVSSFVEEYYLSTSNTTQTGGSWVTSPPAWISGRYMWTRVKTNWVNPTNTTYSTPVLNNLLTAQEQKVVDLQAKTNFLTQTLQSANAIATGSMIVGNGEGANAGITGLGDVNSVRFWAGSNFENRGTANWLMRENGIEEQWLNGVKIRSRGVVGGNYFDDLYNPADGKLAKRTAVINGYITEQWYNNGVLVYEVGKNGIYFVAEIAESFTLKRLLNLNSNVATSDFTVFHNTIRANMYKKAGTTNWFELRGNKDSYQYDAGQNVYSQSNKQYEGYKNTQNKYDNVPDGWYVIEQLGIMTTDGVNESVQLVQIMRIIGGKVSISGTTGVETNGYYFNQF